MLRGGGRRQRGRPEDAARRFYRGGLVYALSLLTVGVLAGDPRTIPAGLWTIFTSQGVLITDYMALAGPGAAFVNAGLVTLLSLGILARPGAPVNGVSFGVLGLTSGFGFFGKNPLNMLPILAGTWLYARLRREPFSRYVPVGLMATALAPTVSFFALAPDWGHRLFGVGVGLVIGFVLPPLSEHTFRLQSGMNLYNMGFACGLFALVMVPVLSALGRSPTPVRAWSVQYRGPVLGFVLALAAFCLLLGTALEGREGWRRWSRILRTTGRAPSDYYLRSGAGATLINMGMNGLACLGYLLALGWDLNGATLGGILTVMGFAAYGKHLGNMVPVMLGVALGGWVLHEPGDPAVQMAGLFGTCLAPITGEFGVFWGVLAGFLHSAIVLRAGIPAEGLNLYNNGFSAGLLAMALYGVLTPLLSRRRPVLQDRDYLETVLGEDADRGEPPADGPSARD